MTPSNNDNSLRALLSHTDAAMPSALPRPLDAGELLARARRRSRRRHAMQSAFSAAAVALLATLAYRHLPTPPSPSPSVPDLAALATDIDDLKHRTALLRQQVAVSIPATCDILTAMEPESIGERRSLDQLRAELSVLESRVAANNTDLEWDIEWSRSGALRLELANQDVTTDPARAAEAYRQIASTYAGTRWGDEARLALVQISQ